MNSDPLNVAIQNIAETRQLLESLILSSEQFDYPKAKQALKHLQRKIRDLNRIQQGLEKRLPPPPSNLTVIDFQNGAPSVAGQER